jgi:hypothetical protein
MMLKLMLSIDELFVLSRVSHPGVRPSVATGRESERSPWAANAEVETGKRRVRTDIPTTTARRCRPAALRSVAVGLCSEGLERRETEGWVGIDPSSAEPGKKLSLENYFLSRNVTSAGELRVVRINKIGTRAWTPVLRRMGDFLRCKVCWSIGGCFGTSRKSGCGERW